MFDSELSTASYGKSEDSVNTPKKETFGVQQIHLQNEQLKDQNDQLKSQVESLNKQLKDALAAATAAQNVGEQIKGLRQQIADEKAKKEKLAKQLKAANATNITQTAKLNDQIKSLEQDLTNEQNKIEALEEHITKIKKERNLLRTALEDKMQLVDMADVELQKTEETKKKLKQKTASALEQLQQAETKAQELQTTLETTENERNELREKVDSLTLQVTSMTAARDEANFKNETMRKELERKDTTINELEAQLAEQVTEIEAFAEERPTLIAIIEKSHKALASNENVVANLQAQNAELLQKVKAAPSQSSKISTQIAQGNILDLKFPFEGEISDKCDEIMKLQQYTPIQRVQLVINEVARYVNQTEKECDAAITKAQEQAEQATRLSEKDQGYGQILASLLKELKERAPQTGNADFINFVNQKCDEIDPDSLPKGRLNSFYNMSSDERAKALKDNKMASKEQLLLGQQKIFDNLKRRSDSTDKLLQKEEAASVGQPEQQSTAAASEHPDERDDIIADLRSQIDKLKASRKQIHSALKEAQENNNAMMIAEKEARTQAMKLQTQVETLQHENEVIKVQLQVAQNDLALRQKEDANNQSTQSSCESLSCTELRQKVEECEKLNEQLRTLQNQMDQAIAKNTRKYKAREEALKQEIDTLKCDIAQREEEAQTLAKKNKRAQKKATESYKKQLDELQTQLDEAKKTYEETVTQLKSKAEEARNLSQQLVTSLNECETKNQTLQDEAAAATKAQKDLQTQIISLKQQLSKEKQNLRTQLSVQSLAQEAKFQEQAAEIRAKADKKAQDILSVAADTIGAFYGIDSTSFNEESFAQLAAHVKSDLDKLRFFQNQMIKYHPSQ